MTHEIWGEVQTALLHSVGENNYKTWIRPIEFTTCEDGVAHFRVPTTFIGNWVNRNYADKILQHLHSAGAEVRRIEFNVHAPRPGLAAARVAEAANDGTAPAAAAMADAPRADTDAGDPLPGARLDARFTFDRFVVGPSNELAHAAARRVADCGPVTFNPLFLYGGVGLGKTHLMHAIAHQMRQSDPEMRIVYLSAEQFMYRFVQALRDRDMMTFKQLFRSVDVLMVDDVQFIAGKDSTQDEFFHTFNALVDQGKQIIISGDRAPGEIEGMEERIKSRLQCGLVVDLHPTDYELRLGILQQKVDLYSEQYRGLVVAPGVLEFLAHRISTNVRVLEGALVRLFAMASLVGREITLDMTQDCLADVLRVSDRKVTVEEIQRRVSEHYNIRLSELIGPTRVRTVARPRQIAMYLCKTLTSRSLPEIGRRFGKRDHTTILHGVKRIEELRARDSQLAEDLELLRRALEA
ncbi:chromosomal replication initiator protein DnaA [Meridianimarinicoccus sp. RP-17]|uniref:chromosomal replication initiator protein DnaA n=1 Tax=Meridianimarinicoccus zhengii TaxID=2056810 RepID=UPI000DAB5A85|nr:chromosomal replication initiator protein DnaA [Phycocomes zhengii]